MRAGWQARGDGEEQPERLAAEPDPAKSLSLTGPAAASTSKGARKASFAYAVNQPAAALEEALRRNHALLLDFTHNDEAACLELY